MKKRRKLLTWLIAGTAVFSVCSLASCTSGKKDGKAETYVVHWNSGSIGKKERDTVYTVGESLFLPQATLYDPDDEE